MVRETHSLGRCVGPCPAFWSTDLSKKNRLSPQSWDKTMALLAQLCYNSGSREAHDLRLPDTEKARFPMRSYSTLPQTFRAKVRRTPTCWIWIGSSSGTGYGDLHVQGRHWLAHRFAYERLMGPIPDGLTIDHLCRNRLCVNPEHMEPVANHENILRGNGASAYNARKTQCSHGHEFDLLNTHWTSKGHRRCRACDALKHRRYYQKYRERILRDSATYSATHRKQLRVSEAAYRERNREKLRAYQRRWRASTS